jgi:hypothetical protein
VRFIHVYLFGYFLLIAGALLVLWRAGVLARVGAFWIAVSLIIALGLGVLLAVTSTKPTTTEG